jgi:Holliday junction resolvasome RuvABC endonuclease subunit
MPHTPTRLLALDPITKGFGYVIFELPFRLVAWGIAHVSGDKHAGAIARFKKLLDHSQVNAVVLEDAQAIGSRRSPRVRRLIEAWADLARERGVAVYTIARKAVLDCFSSKDGRATKHSIAQMLAKHFPELAEKLPARRKAWESEKERMSIFDALALAVTHANQ